MTAYDNTCTEIITPADTIKKAISRILSETITPADTIKRAISRTYSETITPADTIKRGYSRTFLETITPADTINNFHLIDLSGYNTRRINVRKAWGEQLWTAELDIVGTDIPAPFTAFKLSMADKETASVETIFFGFIPGADYTLKKDFETIRVRAYDYTWYLAAQFVPKAIASTDSSLNPSTDIRNLLGGTDWQKTTGIYPMRIEDVPNWAAIVKQWNWDPWKITRWQAIQDICQYCDMIFVVLWKYQPTAAFTGWMPCAYFMTQAQWDDATNQGALGASAADKTIDVTTSVLPVDFSYQKEEQQNVNRIKVITQDDLTGAWYGATAETAAVTAKTELPREKVWGPVCGTWTQAQADTKAATLLSEYNRAAEMFKAKVQAATKLRLGQKVKFTNVTGHPTDLMRITSISHSGEVASEFTEIEYAKLAAVKMTKERTGAAEAYREIQIIAETAASEAVERRKDIGGKIVTVLGGGLYDVQVNSTGQVLRSVRGIKGLFERNKVIIQKVDCGYALTRTSEVSRFPQNPYPIWGVVPSAGGGVLVVGENIFTGDNESVYTDAGGAFILDAANMLSNGYEDGDIIRVVSGIYSAEVDINLETHPDGMEIILT